VVIQNLYDKLISKTCFTYSIEISNQIVEFIAIRLLIKLNVNTILSGFLTRPLAEHDHMSKKNQVICLHVVILKIILSMNFECSDLSFFEIRN